MANPFLAKIDCTKRDINPAERVGTEEDMAGVILYLTSFAGGYCNGGVFVTDGGQMSLLPSSF
jgi:NAD(P)-dependent dehydrogenase (short-subunit alcohol dehydrogenase family)